MEVVALGRREWFDDALRPLRGEGAPEALDRVERAVSIYLRDTAETPGDPRQKPSFLYLPSLGTGPFLDDASLPWLDECLHRIAGLGAEVDAFANAAIAPATRPFNLQRLLGESENAAAKPEVPRRLPIYQHGTLVEGAKTRAPRLMTALETAPLVRIPLHGPDAEIVTLASGEQLPHGHGRTNSRIVVAIALSDGAAAELEVGGERAVLQPSRAIVFDPTFGYALANRAGGTARLVLFEVWHPGLSSLERTAIAAVTSAAVEFDAKLCELP